MNAHELENKMAQHRNAIQLAIAEIQIDVTAFAQSNPEATMYNLPQTNNLCDNLIEHGGWIKDLINGTLRTEKPKKSLVVQLRKVLGYTYP